MWLLAFVLASVFLQSITVCQTWSVASMLQGMCTCSSHASHQFVFSVYVRCWSQVILCMHILVRVSGWPYALRGAGADANISVVLSGNVRVDVDADAHANVDAW